MQRAYQAPRWVRGRSESEPAAVIDNRPNNPAMIYCRNCSFHGRQFPDTRGEIIKPGMATYLPRPYIEYLRMRGHRINEVDRD